MKQIILSLFVVLSVSATSAQERIFSESFDKGLLAWKAEYNHDSTQLKAENGELEIIAPGGLTLWLDKKLEGNIEISYEAFIIKKGGKYDRASDLNCFWMANDTENPDNIFARSGWRNGIFGNYYSLSMYYVGLGGNNNSTTRFRKYDGDYTSFKEHKKRPDIIQEYNDSTHLITPNKWCSIKIIMDDKSVHYYYNDKLFFNYKDSTPYKSGYFGLRTVKNHMKIRNFKVIQK